MITHLNKNETLVELIKSGKLRETEIEDAVFLIVGDTSAIDKDDTRSFSEMLGITQEDLGPLLTGLKPLSEVFNKYIGKKAASVTQK